MSRIKSRFIKWGTGPDDVNSQQVPSNFTPTNYIPTQVASEGTDKVSSNLKGIDTNLGILNAVSTDAVSPMGFVNRTDSTLSYDRTTRTLTVSGTFSYYWKGTKITKTTVTETIQHGTTNGQYFFYYNNTTLSVGAVDVPFDFANVASVAIVYYNNTAVAAPWAGPNSMLFEERHGCTMDFATHQDLHFNIGTYVKGSGFAISGTYAIATGTGGLIDTSYGIDGGIIVDEDIEFTHAALTDNAGVGNQYPVFYRVGTGNEWQWSVNNLPLLFNASNNLYYNQLNVATWQLTAITTQNTYMNMYLCAVNTHSSSSSSRFVWVKGQTTYTTLALAQGESIQNLTLTGFPFSEVAPLYRVTMRYNTGYSTVSGKARIEAMSRIVGTRLSVSLTFNPQNHNNLSNRSDPASHPAVAISVTPSGNLTATDLQVAIDQLELNKEQTLGNPSVTGQVLSSTTVGVRSWVSVPTAPVGDISLTDFILSQTVGTPTNVTGFSFSSSTIRSFQAIVSVSIIATIELYEQFEIRGVNKNGSWVITISSMGDNSNVILSITSTGQIQYTSSTYSGFTSGKIGFRAIVTTI
jgi:hypothetical protein